MSRTIQALRRWVAATLDDRGVVLIWVSVGLPLFLIMAAAVTDFGLARIEKNQLQNSLDAGALAGAPELPSAVTAKSTAAAWVYNNLEISTYAETTCDASYGSETTCYEGDDQTVNVSSPYYGTVIGGHDPDDLVHVEACRTISTTFFRLVSISTLTVCGDATAVVEISGGGGGGGGGECAFCMLGDSGTGLETTGSAGVVVNNGSLHVNSAASGSAIKASGSGYMWSCNGYDPGPDVDPPTPTCGPGGSVTVVGTTDKAGVLNTNGLPYLSPDPLVGQPTVIDPLISVPYPTYVTSPVIATAEYGTATCPIVTPGECWLSPGVYTTIKGGSGVIKLQPGIYVVTKEIVLSSEPKDATTDPKVNVWGENVMIFFGCAAWPTDCAVGEKGGKFRMSGATGMDLSGITGTSGNCDAACVATYQGLVIMSDRNNVSDQSLTGSGSINMSGTLYFPASFLTLTGSTSGNVYESAIIASRAKLTGSSIILIDYDASKNWGGGGGGGVASPGGLVG